MTSDYKIYNATELWQNETALPSIHTFCQQLDSILGTDGIQLGAITEIIGLPGTGKTQLCLQLCASIQVPHILGGLNAEALYIDTNTNFTLCRFKEILFATLAKCQSLMESSIVITEDDALKKIHYAKAIGLEKFCSFLFQLPNFLTDNPNVRLIVIDSIAFPFKDGVECMSLKKRTGLLFRLMADLHKLAAEKQIAVVLTNEMSARVCVCVGSSVGSLVGSLGDAWGHCCNTRLLLGSHRTPDAGRFGVVLKSHVAPDAVANFKITREGIRDID